jgi:hypothetical protein
MLSNRESHDVIKQYKWPEAYFISLLVGGATMLANSLRHDVSEQYSCAGYFSHRLILIEHYAILLSEFSEVA